MQALLKKWTPQSSTRPPALLKAGRFGGGRWSPRRKVAEAGAEVRPPPRRWWGLMQSGKAPVIHRRAGTRQATPRAISGGAINIFL